jgi:uncharacterized repeat protein (TIGR01451 family)
VVDFVGFGSTATGYEGSGPAPAISTTTAALRAGAGSVDTNSNSTDFTAATPNPRNSTVVPDFTIAASHLGNFTQGDQGDVYTLTISNVGVGASGGAVSVVDTLPAGLTATAFAGSGWTTTLGTLTATRSDSLAPGSIYPPLTLTVNVATTAAASVTNSATVSGGAEINTSNDTASDSTTIYTPSQSWRLRYFGTVNNSGTAADSYVYTSDGLPNLLKYALNLNPLVPTQNPVAFDTTTGYLRVSAPKNPAASDISFVPQLSLDLSNTANWGTTGITIDANTSTSLIFHDSTPIAAPGHRFLRLNITRP